MNYFQVLVWPGGGLIGLILWALSFVTIALIIRQFISIRLPGILPPHLPQRIASHLGQRQYRKAIDSVTGRDDVFSCLVRAALLEAPHGHSAMERAIDEAAEQHTTRLLRRIEPLNLIGSVSPMLGLLGTVWGMIRAFFEIVQASGIPAPAELAGAIGIALVTTLLGLAIAIPALAVYAFMRSRIEALCSEAVAAGRRLIGPLGTAEQPERPEARQTDAR